MRARACVCVCVCVRMYVCVHLVTTLQTRRTDFGGGAAMGVLPRGKCQKLKPIASISGHLVPFQCTVTTMKEFLILQKNKKIGYDRGQTLPSLGKKSKIEANCKHSQAFGAISVYMDF